VTVTRMGFPSWESGPVDFEHADAPILGYVEERRFDRVRRAHGNQIAIPDLLPTQLSSQLLHGASFDVVGVA